MNAHTRKRISIITSRVSYDYEQADISHKRRFNAIALVVV